MNAITNFFKYFLFITFPLLFITPVFAQVSHAPANYQLKNFYNQLAQVNLSFTFPEGFKEIAPVNNENLSFDYAMELPGQDFEIWLQIKTQKENEKFVADKNIRVNPDSLYVSVARNEAIAFTDDKNYLERTIPPRMLDRYNADAGKSFLLNIHDSAATKHYKYALLIILQKNHAGTVLAVCFTNQKGPEFFKNMKKAGDCLKFKS